jgi:hypothetical protein
MYTKREELRVNKLRNKREFAYELYDWRNAIEEDDMIIVESSESGSEEEEGDVSGMGELIHPAHHPAERKTPLLRHACSSTSASSRMTSTTTTATTHRHVIQTYSSAMGGYTCGGSSALMQQHNHQPQPRVKRMRMYYP